MNADSRFDSKELRQICEEKKIYANIDINSRNSKIEPQTTEYQYFDDELYKKRTLIENANSWMDSFKALLVRYEFSVRNWMALHFIAFLVIFFRKINIKVKV